MCEALAVALEARGHQALANYWDKIPVTLVDGVQVDFWRVSEARLRAALGEHRCGPSTAWA